MKTWKGVAIFALVVMMVVMVAKKKGTHIHVHLRAPPPLVNNTHGIDVGTVDSILSCVLYDHCADAHIACTADFECGSAVSGDYLRQALLWRGALPWLPRNDGMRALAACASRHCFRRRCEPATHRVALHHSGSGDRRPRYLREDLVRVESAGECAERCFVHVPPVFAETCAGWTWIKQARLDNHAAHHACFLVDGTTNQMPLPGAVSGTCKGGPSSSLDVADPQLCERVMRDESSLKVWLRVQHHVKIDGDRLSQLHDYMTIVAMCPLDLDFSAVLDAFVEKTDSSTFDERLLAMLVDLWETIVALLQRIPLAIWSSLLLPLLLPTLSFLKRLSPTVHDALAPKILKHLGEDGGAAKTQRRAEDTTDNDDTAQVADSLKKD